MNRNAIRFSLRGASGDLFHMPGDRFDNAVAQFAIALASVES
jgi:hypothetical protein